MSDRKVSNGIVQRGNSYRFTVADGMDMNGKQIRHTRTWKAPEGTPQKKADKMAIEQYVEFKNRCIGKDTYDENMRFKYLVDMYFDVYAPNKLKPLTAYNYRKMVDYRFMESFGNKKLKDIKTATLTAFFNSMTKIDAEGNEHPLAPQTVRKVFTIMESIMHFACTQKYINENPCKGVLLPSKDSAEPEKRKYLTEEETIRFIKLFDGYSPFNTMIKVLIYTGMRSGECLGLQWADIDFENRAILVRHNLSKVGGKYILTTPKTKNSRRVISMSDTVYQMLLEHRTQQLKLQSDLGFAFEHSEMVFTGETGNYKDRGNLRISFKKFLKDTEFEWMTLHYLRHCNATLLLNSGVDIKIVSEHLGHADVNVTATVYADVLAETRKRTAEILEFKLAQ